MDHPYPWLKFVDAGDLEHDTVDFDGLDVESPDGGHLGDVEGFIVDADSGRPYYVVVDSGGWFRSKHFLLPVGHARLGSDDKKEALVADSALSKPGNLSIRARETYQPTTSSVSTMPPAQPAALSR